MHKSPDRLADEAAAEDYYTSVVEQEIADAFNGAVGSGMALKSFVVSCTNVLGETIQTLDDAVYGAIETDGVWDALEAVLTADVGDHHELLTAVERFRQAIIKEVQSDCAREVGYVRAVKAMRGGA